MGLLCNHEVHDSVPGLHQHNPSATHKRLRSQKQCLQILTFNQPFHACMGTAGAAPLLTLEVAG